MKILKSILLLGGIYFSQGLSAQSIINEQIIGTEDQEYFNDHTGFAEKMQEQRLGSSSYRLVARKGDDFNVGSWVEYDTLRYTYYRDNKIGTVVLWHWIAGAWQYYSEETNTYNAQHKVVEELHRNWMSSAWTNNSKKSYVYGTALGPDHMYFYLWSGTWDNQNHISYTYDAAGNILSEINQNWIAAVWENIMRTYKTYNSNNTMATFQRQMWDGSTWVNSQKYSYTYNSDNRLTETILEVWNGAAWLLDTRWTKTYNAAGLKTLDLKEEHNGSTWVNATQYLMTYNSSNMLTIEDYQTWDVINSIWENYSRNVYQYDIDNALENVTHYLMGMGWYPDYRNIYTYDVNGYLYSETYQDYLMSWENGNRNFYYYENYVPSAISQTEKTDLINLYPNPAEDYFNLLLESEENEELNLGIYNCLGQLVKTNNIQVKSGKNSFQLSLDGVSTGSYFVQIASKDGMNTVPLQVR